MTRWLYKMQKHKYLLGLMVLIGITFMSIATCTFADVGNSVDYNSGSSGGSSSGSSSSYSGSVDFYMVYWLIRLMIREPLLLLVVLVIAGIYIVARAKGRQEGNGHRSSGYEDDYMRSSNASSGLMFIPDTASIQELVGKDPGFSEQLLVSKVNNMFIRLQLAWMNKVWEEVRPFETDALFNTHKMQLDQYIRSGRTNRIEDICIVNTELLRYYERGEYEYLDVEIKSRFTDYIVEDTTGNVVKGDPRRTIHMQYKWKLARKGGTVTNVKHIEATECPNCGANISINQAGKCEYCGSVVTKGDFDWVLSEIEVISQH
ncbi:MAG: TIM44-like domain-containing protein [Cellulosilyticaceae bacterium]